jgi:virginiamycin A acetyltransferase
MREAVKLLLHAVATLAISPMLLSFHLRRAILGDDRAIMGSSQALSLVPGVLGEYLRRAFFARTLAHCSRSATIGFGTTFSQRGARLDDNVYVGPACHLGLVHLHRDVLLAAAVHVPSGAETHGTADVTRPIREQPGTRTMITIGEGSWVGSAAVVMADIGRHTVIGAGSIVTKPVPDFVVAVGSPARVVRSRVPADASA